MLTPNSPQFFLRQVVSRLRPLSLKKAFLPMALACGLAGAALAIGLSLAPLAPVAALRAATAAEAEALPGMGEDRSPDHSTDHSADRSPDRPPGRLPAASAATPLDPARLGEPLPRNLFVELNKVINPAVVSISTSTTVRGRGRMGGRDPLQEFLEDFWGGRNPGFQPPPQVAQALGTGFIIRADGLIITNNHVVEAADQIKVNLEVASNKFYEAEIVGRDPRTDIALIKIDAKKPLPVALLGTSADLQVGEWVAAFGNPYGHAHTMTKGIVSAVGREINEINRFPFIQTDASINPGNSGGPLANTAGLVIGVNTAIDARAQGIGFAIPIDNVKPIIAQLEKDGRVKRGFVGIGIDDLNPQIAMSLGLETTAGAIITQLQKDGPAAKAGAQLYDVVMEFGGKKIGSARDLMNAVADADIGSRVKIKVVRIEDDRRVEKNLEAKITERVEAEARPERGAKKYFGQKAPFTLGFKATDWSAQTAAEIGLSPNGPQGPIVVQVDPRSIAERAGLRAGDVILDVNRQRARKATDVIKLLREGTNILRVARGDLVLMVALKSAAEKAE